MAAETLAYRNLSRPGQEARTLTIIGRHPKLSSKYPSLNRYLQYHFGPAIISSATGSRRRGEVALITRSDKLTTEEMMHIMRALPVVAAALLVPCLALGDSPRIEFPSTYKTEFKNYFSGDRLQDADQTITIYANAKALEAAKAGQELPDGSVLVAEVYAARKDADGKVVKSSLGRRISENLKAVAVMEKRKGWGDAYSEELRNGDWDFAIFSPDGKRLDKDLNACRSCHAPLKETQHVFSLEHIR